MPRVASKPSKSRGRWICCCLISPCLFLAAISQLKIFLFHHPNPLRSRSNLIISSSTGDGHPQVFLAAVIFNRVFQADKFNITARECRQWVDFMLNAGVDRVIWYDTAHDDSEAQLEHFQDYISSGTMIYHRFYSLFPKVEGSDFHYEQDNSYAHFLANFNLSARWVVEMDVDEYPFSPQDLNPGFLARFIRRIEESKQNSVSQILLQCMLFQGNPIGEGWVIERYQRRNPQTEGTIPGFHSRQKPIFRAELCAGVTNYDPHQFWMRAGSTIVAPAEEMRMNHYWGPRATDFKPDTPEAVASLVEDRTIQPIASMLKIRTLNPTKG